MVHTPPSSNNVSFCTPEDYFKCADPALDFLVEKDQSECLCGTPCNLIKYSIATSIFLGGS